MADTAEIRTSFAFERRAELPDHLGEFYRDAGKARAAFHGTAPRPSAVAHETATHGKERPPTLGLPDPHPSFALPRRPAIDDAPAQTPGKDDFVRLRLAQEFRARVTRGRDV